MTTDRRPGRIRVPRHLRWTHLTASVRARLVGSVALLAALGLLGAGTAALLVERERIEARVERSLAQEVGEFTELATAGTDPRTGGAFADAEAVITASLERNVPDEHETLLGYLPGLTIVPVDGGGSLQGDDTFRAQVTSATTPTYGEYQSPGDGRVVYAVMPFTKGGERSHFVTAYFVDLEMAELSETITSYAAAAALAWAALVAAALALARRVLRPLDELRRTAETITETDVSRRIGATGNDEVAELAHTVDGMLDRLEKALDGQRRMLDDAGHELRTPITVIRGHLELMDPADVVDVTATRSLAIDELDRMARLVEDLVVLAKSRRPDFLRRGPHRVDTVVTATFEKAVALAPRQWALDPLEPATASIDPDRVTQALLQLADNAVAVTGEHDTIAFGCAALPDTVRLYVRDTGPGVPPADRQRIFERFESGRGTRDGTGLGLAIVAAIAAAHGGTVDVASATSGGGALFLLDLPRLPDADTAPPTDEEYGALADLLDRHREEVYG
ncbi:HAMP domain-containing sensor histidine kinase [Fodinibacter luteus]|uniref:histidine kinase n=2 Tax=Fodinibacter luteus TaxID=552064 RepID=A0ABP8KLV1_9MICO